MAHPESSAISAGDATAATQYNNLRLDMMRIAYPAQGRLTLTTSTPVTTADVSTATTLYYTPFNGNIISLYDGTNWQSKEFSEMSLNISGLTASTMYDIWIYDNSGTLTMAYSAWTDATTRATALTTQDGIYVKTGATGYRLVGSIYINSSGGQTDDSVSKRYVCNYYNAVPRRLYLNETTSHTYNGAVRLWNNSTTNNQAGFVLSASYGQVVRLDQQVLLNAGADGSNALTSIYIDGATATPQVTIQNKNIQQIRVGSGNFIPVGTGYHYINLYEYGDHASCTFDQMTLSGMVLA